MIEAVDHFVGSVRVPPSAEWLLNFGHGLSQIWLLGSIYTETAQRLLQTFKARVPVDERIVLFRSLTLGLVREWSKIVKEMDPILVSELISALDWKALGESSRHLSLNRLEHFFDFASEVEVSPSNLNTFCSALDLKSMGEHSSAGITRVGRFLERGRRAGVSAANLNIFCSALDLKDLGERSHDAGPATIVRFLQLARQVGVNNTDLNKFFNALDLKGLSERSRDVSSRTVMKLIKLAKVVGVSVANLSTFCKWLDWHHMGQYLSTKVDESPPLLEFHTVCVNEVVTAEMARKFVEGMGWDAVRLVINAPSGPDTVAALRMLLVKKCGFGQKELARRYVTFGFNTWLHSFVGRPCGNFSAKQSHIQSKYLRFALNEFKGYPPQRLCVRLHNRSHTLRQWCTLIHNLKLADVEYFRLELEPLLRDISQHEMTRLLRDADMLNLGLFATLFAPESGCFTWKPRVDADISASDAKALVAPATLEEIAHPLFVLRYIGVPRWCATIADVLDCEPMLAQKKLGSADIKTVELFFWNLLTARHDLRCPALLDSPEIGTAIIEVAKKFSEEQESLAALCGTLHLWGWHGLGELTPLVNKESALAHCLEAAKLKSPKLIRLVAGLAAVAPLGLSATAQQVIRDGLDSLVFSLDVPSQVLALKQCRIWIETMGDA